MATSTKVWIGVGVAAAFVPLTASAGAVGVEVPPQAASISIADPAGTVRPSRRNIARICTPLAFASDPEWPAGSCCPIAGVAALRRRLDERI